VHLKHVVGLNYSQVVLTACYRSGSAVAGVRGEGLCEALYPFQRSFVRAEFPAFPADHVAAIAEDLAALGFHTLREGVGGLVFSLVS